MKTLPYIKIIFAVVIFTQIFSACNSKNNKDIHSGVIELSDIPGVIEVLVFHEVKQCTTCEAIKKYSKEVVDLYFSDQEKSNKILYKIVDFSLPENKAIADKYEIAWTSLVVVKNMDDGKEEFVDMGDFAIENARRNTDLFKQGLKEQIENYLD